MANITDMFSDQFIIQKIKNKLPYLFSIAEAEASRGGKLGMEIGSVRERIIIALLRYYFGKNNVSDDVPITETETDVVLFGCPISIKTKTGPSLSGIKLIWTVDWDKIDSFVKTYKPKTDVLLVRIAWGRQGGLYHMPLSVQPGFLQTLATRSM